MNGPKSTSTPNKKIRLRAFCIAIWILQDRKQQAKLGTVVLARLSVLCRAERPSATPLITGGMGKGHGLALSELPQRRIWPINPVFCGPWCACPNDKMVDRCRLSVVKAAFLALGEYARIHSIATSISPPARVRDPKDLYVAMTRGTKSLTIIGSGSEINLHKELRSHELISCSDFRLARSTGLPIGPVRIERLPSVSQSTDQVTIGSIYLASWIVVVDLLIGNQIQVVQAVQRAWDLMD